MAKKSTGKSGKKATAFRVGRVRVYLRGRVWHLCYHEHGKRKQPRVGPDREVARQMAAEINAQLEVRIPSSLGFEPISIVELRQRWLDQHEHVRRSSLQTIRRYRTATEHLINFIKDERPVFVPSTPSSSCDICGPSASLPTGTKTRGSVRSKTAASSTSS